MVTLQFNEVVKDLAKCCSEQLKFLILCIFASTFRLSCNFNIRFKLQQITFKFKRTKKTHTNHNSKLLPVSPRERARYSRQSLTFWGCWGNADRPYRTIAACVCGTFAVWTTTTGDRCSSMHDWSTHHPLMQVWMQPQPLYHNFEHFLRLHVNNREYVLQFRNSLAIYRVR